MNPDLDVFLNEAFQSIQPTAPKIGRVVVVPDFETAPQRNDSPTLAEQLTQLLREQSPDAAALASKEGTVVPIPVQYPLLAKYVRSVTLYNDPPPQGPWVEVAPPGYWI